MARALETSIELRTRLPASEILAYEHAVALCGLRRMDEAVEMLEESARLGRRDLGLMQHDARLDSLRGHPKFQSLLSQLTTERAVMRAHVLQQYPQAGV